MFIIAQKAGRLGNRLFLFAYFIACATENKFSVMNPAFGEYAEYFQTTGKDFLCRYPARKSFFKGNKKTRELFYNLISRLSLFVKNKIQSNCLQTIELPPQEGIYSTEPYPRRTFFLDNPSFLEAIKNRCIVFFRGFYFRDKTNFIKHADKIREYFKPVEKHRRNISNLITGIRKSCEVLIGVHVRCGEFAKGKDIKSWFGGKYFYDFNAYIKVMKKIKELFPDKKVTFLICSDVKQNENNFSGFNIAFGIDHIIEDLYSLAQCDYIVGPPSTYNAWASFYGKVPLYVIADPHKDITLNSFKPVKDIQDIDHAIQLPSTDITESLLFSFTLKPRALTRSKMLKSLAPSQKWFFGTEESHESANPFSLDGRIPPQMREYTLPYIRSRPFVCEITDAELIGPKAIGLTQKGHIILETTSGRMWVLKERSDPSWVLKKDSLPVECELDTACSLVGGWSHSYGHWLQDYITQIQGVEYYQKKTGRKPLLIVPKNPTPWHIESLKLIGYGPDDYIEWNTKRAKVKRLIICSNGRFEERHPDDYVSAQSLRWIRERIFSNLPKSGDEIKYSKKIFISRRKTPWRRILNEDEIMGVLGPMGYTFYVPEEMSFSEQVKLFSQAKVVISPFGSCLWNITFSQKALVIELFVDKYTRPDNFQIAKILGLKYGFLVGKTQNKEKLDYTIDVDGLRGLLKKMGEDK